MGADHVPGRAPYRDGRAKPAHSRMGTCIVSNEVRSKRASPGGRD